MVSIPAIRFRPQQTGIDAIRVLHVAMADLPDRLRRTVLAI
jgi:hypothetical protein